MEFLAISLVSRTKTGQHIQVKVHSECAVSQKNREGQGGPYLRLIDHTGYDFGQPHRPKATPLFKDILYFESQRETSACFLRGACSLGVPCFQRFR